MDRTAASSANDTRLEARQSGLRTRPSEQGAGKGHVREAGHGSETRTESPSIFDRA